MRDAPRHLVCVRFFSSPTSSDSDLNHIPDDSLEHFLLKSELGKAVASVLGQSVQARGFLTTKAKQRMKRKWRDCSL